MKWIRCPGLRRIVAVLTVTLSPALYASGAVYAENAAVVSPERIATSAGLNILREGGTAADAAIAIAFTLTVLRPDTASVFGGGTALYFDATGGEVWALDFRQALPNTTYVAGTGTDEAVPLAVPGLPAGLSNLHEKFGSASWASLLQPAIALSRENTRSEGVQASLEGDSIQREIDALPSGTEPAILERVAARGAAEIYSGATSELLVARSRELGGAISRRALEEYRARWRSPLRLDYRGDRIYTIPAPAGAGSVLAEELIVLSGFEWKKRSIDDPGTTHLFVEAERHGWNQAARMLSERGAPARQVPVSPEDPAEIRSRIEKGPITGSVKSVDEGISSLGFVVVDADGNAAVMTLSMGPPFGSGKVAGEEAYIAVAPERGSVETALPVLAVREGKAALLIASTGLGREAAIGGNLYLRSMMLGAGVEELLNTPRFIPAYDEKTIMVETGTDLGVVEELNRLGHGAEWHDQLGIVHAIEIDDRIAAIADPRGGTPGGY